MSAPLAPVLRSLVLVVAFASCTTAERSPIPAQPGLAPEREQPRVTIIEPRSNETLRAGDITMTVTVEDFVIVGAAQGGRMDGARGRLIYYRDVDVPTAPDEPAATEEGTFELSTETTYTVEDLPPGRHELSVQLVEEDGTPLDPPAFDTVIVIAE